MTTLKSGDITATLSTLGARISAVTLDGFDVIMGGGTDEKCMAGDWTAGITCGRHAGRIANSKFTLDGVTHHLTPSMAGGHQLHGGPDNFGIRHWTSEPVDHGVKFTLVSPDGDQGFPGELTATSTYRLIGNTLSCDLEATTTKPTIINLTNHAYWNLGCPSAFEHEAQIVSDHMIPLDELLLVKGEIKPVENTRWDFRKLRVIGEDYDNCWQLNGPRSQMKHGLTIRDPKSGRRMDVHTTEKGMQFYTAFHWNEKFPGKQGPLKQYQAIAIEPQNLPDACNHHSFPSAVLRPGETYQNKIEWRFS